MGIDQSKSDTVGMQANAALPANSSLSSSNPDDPCHDYSPATFFVQRGTESDRTGHYTRGGVWIPAI